MTTIAYHHKERKIAVDGRVSAGPTILTDNGIKVHECEGVTFVLCGNCSDIETLIRDYPNIDQELGCYGIMIKDGDAYDVGFGENGKLLQCTIYYNAAFGSGCDFALAAMDLGMSAASAVNYAMTRDSATGGAVRVIDLGPISSK